MHLSLSMSNVLHQCIGDTINIIYEPLGNLFDHILFLSNPNLNFYILDSTTQYDVNNAKVLPPSFTDLYSYNLYISNNPLAFVNNNLSQVFHINSLLMFHADKPATLKKEDRVIINNKIRNQTKIFFESAFLENWQINNKTQLLSYAVPLDYISYSNNCTNREKDILIIGDSQSVVNRSLQQSFTEMNYLCDIQSLHQSNIHNIDNILNTYKICVDLNSSCWINCLCACAAGCYSVCHTNQNKSAGLSSIFDIDSIDSVIKTTQQLLQNYHTVDHLSRVQEMRSTLKQNYNFDIFKGQSSSVIENLSKQEVFII